MSERSVYLYVNNSKPYFSKYLNKEVLLVEPEFKGEITLRKIEHSLKNVKPLILSEFNNLSALSPLFLYCFNEDKISFQTFFTLTEAYQNLYPKNTEWILKNRQTFTGSYNYIRNRINLDEPAIAEDGKSYYFAKNPERSDAEFRVNSVIWLINLKTFEAKLFSNLKKVEAYLKSFSPEMTLRICGYYKDTGKIYKNYLFISHKHFIKVMSDASKPGLDKLDLKDVLVGVNLNNFIDKLKSILSKEKE